MSIVLKTSAKREIARRKADKDRAWRLEILTHVIANTLGLTHRTIVDALTSPAGREGCHKALDAALDVVCKMQEPNS